MTPAQRYRDAHREVIRQRDRERQARKRAAQRTALGLPTAPGKGRRVSEDVFWSRVAKSENCWEYQGLRLPGAGKDYGSLRFAGRMWRAHRLAWALVNGPIPKGMHVLHRCDNPPCVRPEHLFLGTNADNVADREAKGRRRPPRGQDNGNAKLTVEQVREIRRLASDGHTYRGLATTFGVSESTLAKAARGVTWPHV